MTSLASLDREAGCVESAIIKQCSRDTRLEHISALRFHDTSINVLHPQSQCQGCTFQQQLPFYDEHALLSAGDKNLSSIKPTGPSTSQLPLNYVLLRCSCNTSTQYAQQKMPESRMGSPPLPKTSTYQEIGYKVQHFQQLRGHVKAPEIVNAGLPLAAAVQAELAVVVHCWRSAACSHRRHQIPCRPLQHRWHHRKGACHALTRISHGTYQYQPEINRTSMIETAMEQTHVFCHYQACYSSLSICKFTRQKDL